jgi:Nif-specific regulatory protein
MNILRITSTALDMLMVYHWPGNIRELENVIERAAILSIDRVIHSYHLPPSLQTAVSSNTRGQGTLASALAQVEKQMIIDVLIANNGNSAKSAIQLGVTERIIGLRIKQYGIKPHFYKIQSNESN